MSCERLVDYLEQIRRAAADARGFMEGYDQASFLRDKRTQQAVVMSLIIVGEAAARIMDRFPDFIALQPDVPWHAMRGMRNRMAHGYFELDLNLVWETVSTALPDLLVQVEKAALAAAGAGRP